MYVIQDKGENKGVGSYSGRWDVYPWCVYVENGESVINTTSTHTNTGERLNPPGGNGYKKENEKRTVDECKQVP